MVPKGFQILFIDISSTLIESTSRNMPGQCGLRNICYRGNKALPVGSKRGRNGAKMLIIDNFFTVVPYIKWK